MVIAVAAAMAFLGCYGGQTPAPTKLPSTTPSATPTSQINEEREILKQWWQMYDRYDSKLDEDDLYRFEYELKRWDVHPIEIYRGSILFYEKSYGYIYIPEYDDDVREMPPGMTETKFADLVKKHGGTTTVIFSWEQPCACFPNLRDAEKFLADFWEL